MLNSNKIAALLGFTKTADEMAAELPKSTHSKPESKGDKGPEENSAPEQPLDDLAAPEPDLGASPIEAPDQSSDKIERLRQILIEAVGEELDDDLK